MVRFFSIASVYDYFEYLGTTQFIRIGIFFFVLLLAVGYGVGFAVGTTNAREEADKEYTELVAIQSHFQMDFVTQVTRAQALAATVASFAAAGATKPTNFSSSAASRLQIDSPQAFMMMCQDLIAELPGIYSVLLAPGGVVAQVCPVGSIPVGFDTTTSPIYADSYERIWRDRGPVVAGPTQMATLKGGVSITTFYPLFVNGSTVPRTKETYWGGGGVVLELKKLIEQKDVRSYMDARGLHYAFYYEFLAQNERHVIETNIPQGDEAALQAVFASPFFTRMPVSEPGRASYLAFLPANGLKQDTVSAKVSVTIVFVVLAAAIAILFGAYLLVYSLFIFRHRHAPENGSQVFAAVLTLRGAQPIAERAPLEAVRMFSDFFERVHNYARLNSAYPVCMVGDRSVVVIADNAKSLLHVCRSVVFNIAIQGSTPLHNLVADSPHAAVGDDHSNTNTARAPSCYSRGTATRTLSIAKGVDITTASQQSSSFIGTAICRPSAAIHTATARCVYDAVKDRYFFGNTSQRGQLCAVADLTKGGGVGWTAAVEEVSAAECRDLESGSVSCHTISQNNEVVLHVASLWKETGDERDNEDPSVAMAALSDVHVSKMSILVGRGQSDGKGFRKKGGGSQGKDSTNKTPDATAVTRNATILHIAILDDAHMPLDIIRRIVAEEKGAVVSGHENVLVVAFNLLSPGGHHQVRAADTVLRLRAALLDTPFVCSLHHGKVNALIIDGLVLCSGDAVHAGRLLLDKAVALRTQTADRSPLNVSLLRQVMDLGDGPAADDKGLCLLYAVSELSSTYECEAVDVMVNASAKDEDANAPSRLRVAYRLAHRKSGKGNDDEWMYRLKDEEDQSPFAAVNAVFNRIAAGDIAEAADIWAKMKADNSILRDVSVVAQVSIENHLSKPSEQQTRKS